MTFNIQTSANTFTFASNPIIYTVAVADISATDFKFLANVTIDGDEIKLSKQPTNGIYQYFDLSRIVENYVSYDFNGDLDHIYYRPNSSIDYTVQFGYYSGGTEVFDTIDEKTGYVWNASVDRNTFLDYDGTQYEMKKSEPLSASTSTNAGDFLTYFKTRNVDLEDYGTVSTLNWGLNYNYIYVDAYDITGTFIKAFRIENTYTANSDVDRICLDIPAYPSNLNDAAIGGNVELDNGAASTGTVIGDTVGYYNVYSAYVDLFGTKQRTSEVLRFNVKDNCTKWEHINVAWKNMLGAFDFYNFTMKNVKTNTITSNGYTKVLGGMDGANWSYGKQDFERVNYLKNYEYEYLINTDWLNDDESRRIIELISSQVQYAKIDGEYLPVNCTVQNIENKTKRNNKLVRYSISFKLAYNNKSNRL